MYQMEAKLNNPLVSVQYVAKHVKEAKIRSSSDGVLESGVVIYYFRRSNHYIGIISL